MTFLIVNFAVTLYMIGVIWMVQLVHYPLMANVGKETFCDYHHRHVQMMTFVVGPSMLVEAFTMLAILAQSVGIQFNLALIGTILVFVIWLSTAFLQVPCHSRLENKFDSSTHRFLVRSNWIRTVAWSLRGIILYLMIANLKNGISN